MGNVSRNSPCPCGSGKKYKRCCEGKSESPGVNKKMLGALGVVAASALGVGAFWDWAIAGRIAVVGAIVVWGVFVLFKPPGKNRDRNSGSNIDFGR